MSMEVAYAAELIVGLTGPARSPALQLTESELWPYQELRNGAIEQAQLLTTDPQQPVEARWVTSKEVNYLASDNSMKRLERDLLQSKPVQRGERMESSSARPTIRESAACAWLSTTCRGRKALTS